jgi:hypothetical protein
LSGPDAKAPELPTDNPHPAGNAGPMLRARPLPPCSGPGRQATALSAEPSKDPAVTQDWLIVAPSQRLPDNFKEALGARVLVTRYNTEKPDGLTLAASGLPLHCLPARIRVTADYAYQYEGTDALRNYDQDPNGAGVIHPKMQELLSR